LAEDKLFATLDSTSRRLELPGGLPVLLVDTVGFIRRLPHALIEAFHSTLEEASLADILIHVLDASDPDIDTCYETTLSVLRELKADHIPSIIALNKADRGEAAERMDELGKRFDGAIPLSAVDGKGLPELLARLESLLSGQACRFRFPPARTDLAALLHRGGTVLSREYGEDYIEMEARVDEKTAGQLKQYIVE
jgi:GTP-binding protein HflX